MSRENSNEGRNAGPGGPGGAAGNGGRGGGGKKEGKQVYSGPIGPTKTGDPMGNGQHFAEKGTGFGGFMDSVLGYDTVGDRVKARQNVVSHNNAPVAYVPSFPYASPGYVAASILSAPMSPLGAAMYAPNIAQAMYNNQAPESMMQKMSEYMGATRGPQGPDVGVGHDLGGKGGNVPAGFNLPKGYMGQTGMPAPTVSPTPTANPPQTTVPQMTNPAQFLSSTPGYGVWAPQYSYFGANSPVNPNIPKPVDQVNPYNPMRPPRPGGIR